MGGDAALVANYKELLSSLTTAYKCAVKVRKSTPG